MLNNDLTDMFIRIIQITSHSSVSSQLLITDAMNIDGSQSYADANRSGYVARSSSINIPSDCEIATREVMVIDLTHVMVRLTGFTTSAHLKIWIAFYNSGIWYGWE